MPTKKPERVFNTPEDLRGEIARIQALLKDRSDEYDRMDNANYPQIKLDPISNSIERLSTKLLELQSKLAETQGGEQSAL